MPAHRFAVLAGCVVLLVVLGAPPEPVAQSAPRVTQAVPLDGAPSSLQNRLLVSVDGLPLLLSQAKVDGAELRLFLEGMEIPDSRPLEKSVFRESYGPCHRPLEGGLKPGVWDSTTACCR